MSDCVRRSALVLTVLAGALGPSSGCGSGSAASPGTVLRDPPPLPKEETTEELIRQQAKTKPKARISPRSDPRAR